MTRAQLASEILLLITDPQNKQNTAAKVREALGLLISNCANLEEDDLGGGFDPEAITTFLKFTAVFDKWIGKKNKLTGDDRDSHINFGANEISIRVGNVGAENNQLFLVFSKNGIAVNIVKSTGGNIVFNITENGIEGINKVLLGSEPSSLADLDLVYKKWVVDQLDNYEVPDADSTTKGKAKLYNDLLDYNTDGSVAQNVIKTAIDETLIRFNIILISSVNVNLTGANEDTLVDGVPIGTNLVLLTAQTNPSQNGIYSTNLNGSITYPFRNWVNLTSEFGDPNRYFRYLFRADLGSTNQGSLFVTVASFGANQYAFQKVGGSQVPDATETTKGKIQLATDAEVQAGTGNTKAVTSLKLANWWTWIKTQAQTISGLWTFTDTVKVQDDVARVQLITTNDSNEATIERGLLNTFKLKNKVFQAGGIGKSLILQSNLSQYGTGAVDGIMTNGNISISIWVKENQSLMFSRGILRLGTIIIALNNSQLSLLLVNSNNFTTGIAVTPGEWYNVVVALTNNGAFQFYVNGVFAFQNGLGGNSGNNYIDVLNIGKNFNWEPGHPSIEIDQVVIWNAHLSAGQASTIYNSGSGTSSLPELGSIVRRWEFEEGIGSNVSDVSGNDKDLTLFNNPTWTLLGKVPVQGSATDATILESIDGETHGERGVVKLGDFFGRTILQGNRAFIKIQNKLAVTVSEDAKVLISPNNTDYEAIASQALHVVGDVLITGQAGSSTRFVQVDLNGKQIPLPVQNANKVLVGPVSGADAQPTFRNLVAADLPSVFNRVLKVFRTKIATSATVIDLYSYDIPANTLVADGDFVEFLTHGNYTTTSSGDWDAFFKGSQLFGWGNGINIGLGKIKMTVIRETSTKARVLVEWNFQSSNTILEHIDTGMNWTNAINIKTTGVDVEGVFGNVIYTPNA